MTDNTDSHDLAGEVAARAARMRPDAPPTARADAMDRGLLLAAAELLAGHWDELTGHAAEYARMAGHDVPPAELRAVLEHALAQALRHQRYAVAKGAPGPAGGDR